MSGAAGESPVRGAQSFVGVMTAVWRRPSLSGLEILWRWGIGAPILALLAWRALLAARTITLDTAALEAMTVFQPVAAFHAIDAALRTIAPAAKSIAVWLAPLAAVAWLVAAALGRTLVLRRFDGTLRARPLTLLALGTLRAALLTAVWILWLGMVEEAGQIAILGPAAHGSEPNIVFYCAILICGTILLYVLWALCGWPFQLAPLLAMQRGCGPLAALQAAFLRNAARAKLIEVNLVMNIVKIGLLVLAMVFSATPLPFTNVETKEFLELWWCGVILLYFAALDCFHVVHAVAHLSLWRTLHAQPELHTQPTIYT